MPKKRWYEPFLWIAGVEAIGYLSAWLSGDIGMVYAMLPKPPLSPPGWVFAVVWPILYALIAWAAWRIYRSDACKEVSSLFWYGVQLALNFFWSILFFRWGLFWAAAVVLLLMIILTASIILTFASIDRVAAYLMVPYFIWILFAWYLNLGVAWLA